ncbi:MAG: Glu/Leu/Phe/Val dehydrogenase [Bacteroidetes bacterium]|nr:Glu/Leu/Phe/Val dehydrogenase [Bacteroidota bacterium]MCB0804043.1 Glu/Leu/Phe/Val dehydrogenase [Flavobacteriales bacterium]NOG57176.1 Glu/Leu/Phe/Val dehydrogenase [Bacteroidota bacterium]
MTVDNNPVIEKMAINDHEQVVFCQDQATGLKAIIAIHNTTLGPALGGTRMWMYNNELEALNDVLRLSRGMTFKASITGLNLGGGKAVIIGDSYTQKSEALFRRFGKFVESLSGKYITAEDVGISPQDMEYVKMETNHVSGLPVSLGGSGDPSPVTAYGVYMGMKAAAKEMFGSDSLGGKKVTVQGVGHVGETLVKHLSKEGAIITLADINVDRANVVAKNYGANVVDGNSVYDVDMDIYAPCALGSTLNDETISKLNCSIIAGAANNQLKDEVVHGKMLKDKGILYAPDFLINAGGLVNVYREVEHFSQERAMEITENIYNTTLAIFKTANEENITTHQAALEVAKRRIESVGRLKMSL